MLDKLESMDFTPLQHLMQALMDRGIMIGLVTNDITANTKAFLEVMGIDRYVRFLRTKESNCRRKPSDESIRQFSSLFGNCRRKPSDESIRQFSSLFGIDPMRIAIVGDSIVDMEYAKAGDVGYTVAVMTGYGKREVLEKYADVVYDKVEDLIDDPVLFPEVL